MGNYFIETALDPQFFVEIEQKCKKNEINNILWRGLDIAHKIHRINIMKRFNYYPVTSEFIGKNNIKMREFGFAEGEISNIFFQPLYKTEVEKVEMMESFKSIFGE